jgi:hypothetical protein
MGRSSTEAVTKERAFGPGTWLFLVLVAVACTLGLIEANYRWGLRAPRDEIDVRLETVRHLSPRHYRAVLLSDSVAHNPIRDYELADDVLDLTTTNGPTLLGAKLMMQRVFRAGASTDEVVLFARPEYLNLDLETVGAGIFLMFNEPQDVKAFEAVGVRGYQPHEIYLKNRLDALNLASYFIVKTRLPKLPFHPGYVLERGLGVVSRPPVPDWAIGAREPNMGILASLGSLCKEHRARLTVVLAPMSSQDHALVVGSPLERRLHELQNAGVLRYVDSRAIAPLPDEAFFDGAHPRRNWGKYYLVMIDRHVVPILPPGSQSTSDGDAPP